MLNNASAYLLVSHGSRDPRPQREVERLVDYVREQLQLRFDLSQAQSLAPIADDRAEFQSAVSISQVSTSNAAWPVIGAATLELAEQPLHQQIIEFTHRFTSQLADAGVPQPDVLIEVVPLFLLPGMHVMEDVPAEVALAQQAIGHEATIRVRSHLGAYPGLKELLRNVANEWSAAKKILLAHGSRRPGSCEPVASLAADLGAIPAYWAISPSLESQVSNQVKIGCDRMVILPYFLFSGGITDAIAQTVAQLSQSFPQVQLQLAEPLGASPALAKVIVDNI